ncbi:hypothetical protein MT325_M083R [Paramecium bursaria chlorella virus MT325]|uniref:Uncharacterized protein M083R n=1 Tax=Paramecium bursaria Chlorella virus MT325 TaxID=346932 RepID=A7ITG3_PBCVM|nr:hypothetical protein MT325_M083R [Paramecium bursaria chlorella virus MT325]
MLFSFLYYRCWRDQLCPPEAQPNCEYCDHCCCHPWPSLCKSVKNSSFRKQRLDSSVPGESSHNTSSSDNQVSKTYSEISRCLLGS